MHKKNKIKKTTPNPDFLMKNHNTLVRVSMCNNGFLTNGEVIESNQ